MKILYIDTTTSFLYTGLVVDRKLLCEIKEDFGKDLSSVALMKINSMLEDNNYKPNDIDKIIVVNGPGSFTGIRVGITIAKTFAYSLKKKITTITSLQAMAISDDSNVNIKIPIIDARRGYVYSAIYYSDLTEILKPQYIKLETLKCAEDSLCDDYIHITNQEFEGINSNKYNPNIEKIVNTCENFEEINPHSVNPIYLKQTEAEEKKNN